MSSKDGKYCKGPEEPDKEPHLDIGQYLVTIHILLAWSLQGYLFNEVLFYWHMHYGTTILCALLN